CTTGAYEDEHGDFYMQFVHW
nr:immunoglobulin heavy chain junction region [Macaca mulatta]